MQAEQITIQEKPIPKLKAVKKKLLKGNKLNIDINTAIIGLLAIVVGISLYKSY